MADSAKGTAKDAQGTASKKADEAQNTDASKKVGPPAQSGCWFSDLTNELSEICSRISSTSDMFTTPSWVCAPCASKRGLEETLTWMSLADGRKHLSQMLQ